MSCILNLLESVTIKMKQLKDYRVTSRSEVWATKRFINGETFDEVFPRHLMKGFLTILAGVELLK